MPTYQVVSANRPMTRSEKQAIAQAITAAHGASTGAPGHFAQVMFRELQPHDHFVGGRENAAPLIFVHGMIRAGRAGEAKRGLCEALVRAVAGILRLPVEDVWAYLQDIDAGQMVEFGRILPEPGGEAAWTEAMSAEKRAALRAAGLDL